MCPQAWGGMLYTMDAGLGNITQELKAQRMWAQTLMVVTVRCHSNHKFFVARLVSDPVTVTDPVVTLPGALAIDLYDDYTPL